MGNSWFSSRQSAGVLAYQHQVLEFLDGSGVASLHEVTVKGKTNFNGTFKATASKFGSDVSVNGAVSAIKSVFNANVWINGALTAVDSNFEGQVSIATEQVTLKHSTITKDLIVRQSSCLQQVVTLSKGSMIKGSVIFEMPNGKIKLLDGSKILGSIQGAVKEEGA